MGNEPGADDEPRLDNNLHAYFIELSGNRYIQEFFDRYGRFYQPLFDYAALGGSIETKMSAQHREILESLIQGNLEPAREALKQHIRDQYPAVLEVIEQRGLRESSSNPFELNRANGFEFK